MREKNEYQLALKVHTGRWQTHLQLDVGRPSYQSEDDKSVNQPSSRGIAPRRRSTIIFAESLNVYACRSTRGPRKGAHVRSPVCTYARMRENDSLSKLA